MVHRITHVTPPAPCPCTPHRHPTRAHLTPSPTRMAPLSCACGCAVRCTTSRSSTLDAAELRYGQPHHLQRGGRSQSAQQTPPRSRFDCYHGHRSPHFPQPLLLPSPTISADRCCAPPSPPLCVWQPCRATAVRRRRRRLSACAAHPIAASCAAALRWLMPAVAAAAVCGVQVSAKNVRFIQVRVDEAHQPFVAVRSVEVEATF